MTKLKLIVHDYQILTEVNFYGVLDGLYKL